MTKSSKSKSTKQRVKVKDLPAAKKKMTAKELKKVKGGYSYDFNNDGTFEVKKRKTPSSQIVDYIDED